VILTSYTKNTPLTSIPLFTIVFFGIVESLISREELCFALYMRIAIFSNIYNLVFHLELFGLPLLIFLVKDHILYCADLINVFYY
jgi:hypothetical protein